MALDSAAQTTHVMADLTTVIVLDKPKNLAFETAMPVSIQGWKECMEQT